VASEAPVKVSFMNAKTKDGQAQGHTKEASGNGTMPRTPPVEYGSLPDLHPVSYAEGMAALAASLCGLGRSKATLPRK
jgi:hypothetical protein